MLCVGCGHLGIDPLPDAAPVAPVALDCAGQHFPVELTADQLAATATDRGYAVFPVDSAARVTGYSFQFEPDHLVAGVSGVAIGADATGEIGPFAVGDDVLLALPHGDGGGAATGTTLLSLDPQLVMRNSWTYDGALSAAGSLTRRSAGEPLALLSQDLSTGAVYAALMSPPGNIVVGPNPVIDGSEQAYNQTILPNGLGFVVAWDATTTDSAPDEIHARVISDQLEPSSSPTSLTPEPARSANAPRVAYLAAADRYLFTWWEKPGSGDQVWISLRDRDLKPIGNPVLISSERASVPAVVAGGSDFLVVWEGASTPPAPPVLGAARVSAAGEITPAGIHNTGGGTTGWDLVVRDGQTALIWLEIGGLNATPNLWFDPVCAR